MKEEEAQRKYARKKKKTFICAGQTVVMAGIIESRHSMCVQRDDDDDVWQMHPKSILYGGDVDDERMKQREKVNKGQPQA